MLYLDTSALVKLIRREPESDALADWLAAQEPTPWVSSTLIEVELPRAIRRAEPSVCRPLPRAADDPDLSHPRFTVAIMANRKQSDGGGAGFALLLFIALLWWLRWVILAGVVLALLVIVARWSVRSYAGHRAAKLKRLSAIRQRAELENAQVLRGDPHGFYGRYPLPDPTLIPRWYQAG